GTGTILVTLAATGRTVRLSSSAGPLVANVTGERGRSVPATTASASASPSPASLSRALTPSLPAWTSSRCQFAVFTLAGIGAEARWLPDTTTSRPPCTETTALPLPITAVRSAPSTFTSVVSRTELPASRRVAAYRSILAAGPPRSSVGAEVAPTRPPAGSWASMPRAEPVLGAGGGGALGAA